jgi:pyruvate/2-oxoglutarate dehydrogenase complex dihydrolipoamide dehydrogenase (E3) component
MGLDRGNVAFDGRGVKVDAGLRSVTNRRVYAVGDAAGGLQFTHLAGYHAGIVIRSALFGLPAKARTDHIPRATYTDPEIAHVGLTEAEARAAHPSLLEVLEVPFHDNDRAQATGKTSGFVKLMAVKGRPLGVTIVGEGAGELIAPWALAISAGLKLSAVAGAVLPYPTMAEAGKRAAGAYFSPRLFGNAWVKRAVRIVQRVLP